MVELGRVCVRERERARDATEADAKQTSLWRISTNNKWERRQQRQQRQQQQQVEHCNIAIRKSFLMENIKVVSLGNTELFDAKQYLWAFQLRMEQILFAYCECNEQACWLEFPKKKIMFLDIRVFPREMVSPN